MAAKKLKISISTLFDRGLAGYIGHLDRGIARARKLSAALRNVGNSAPFRALRLGVAALASGLIMATLNLAKFNTQIARAWTMSGKGIAGFFAMRKEVRALSAEFGMAKSELADGLYQALSAGVPEDNIFSFLRTATTVAVADSSDVATAVDGLTTVINAFKLESSAADQVADQMFNTVANGKTTFADLARSMATVAPLAAANGVAFEEVLAAVSTLTKQGTPTSQAMTQIRSAIVATTKVMGDGWAKTMSLQDAFGQVSDQAGGSQNQLMKLVGSIEAVNGVMGLTGLNAQMAADDLRSAADATGTLGQAFAKVDQWRHWPKLWQSISGLVSRTAQEADSRLAPAVTRIVSEIAQLQDNDDLWHGLTAALDNAESQITGIIEFIRTGGDDAGQEVLAEVAEYMKGAAMDAGHSAISVLAAAVPAIGRAFGAAAKDVLFGGKTSKEATRLAEVQTNQEFGVDDLNSRTRTDIQRASKIKRSAGYQDRLMELEPQKLKEVLARQGVELVGQVGDGPGGLKKADALSKLNDFSLRGQGALNLRRAEEDDARAVDQAASDQRAKQERRAAQYPAEAKLIYQTQRQEEKAAAQAAISFGPPSESAMHNLQNERDQTAQVVALIKVAMDSGYTESLLVTLRQVVQDKVQLEKAVNSLRDEVRNGRS